MTKSLIRAAPIVGPQAWRGPELAQSSSWIYELSDAEIESASNAAAELKKKGLSFPSFTQADFPLPLLADFFANAADELEDGRGFLLVRGFPVDRLDEHDLNTMLYGFGLNLGLPVRQNPKGDLIGRVENVGDLNDKNTRVYETNRYLPYHTDPSDVFGLLCVRQAKSGGLNALVSSAVVYNELLEHHPEYVGLFYRRWLQAHLGDEVSSPIFSYHDEKMTCRYLRQYIELGHENHGFELTQVEINALDLFDEITHDASIRLEVMLEPGDMLLANNASILHSRTSFEEFDEPSQRRRMLRLWLKMSNARTLAPDFPGRNGFGVPGDLTANL